MTFSWLWCIASTLAQQAKWSDYVGEVSATLPALSFEQACYPGIIMADHHKSEAHQSIHETMEALYSAGAITLEVWREFESVQQAGEPRKTSEREGTN